MSSRLLFDVTTQKGSVTVLLPNALNYIYAGVIEPVIANLSRGSIPVDLCGVVFYYRGTSPKIVIRKPEDINIMTLQPVGVVKFSELASNIALYEGQTVKTQARFIGVMCEAFDDPCRLGFVDPLNESIILPIMMSKDLMATVLDPWTTGSRTILNLTLGVVNSTYIIAYGATPVEVVPPVETTSVSSVLGLERGTIVVLKQVKVSSTSVTSGGSWRVFVVDNTGKQILVFVPSTIARQISDTPPPVNTVISVAGYRHVYAGTDEIVVYSVNGLKTETVETTTTTTPTPPPQPEFISIDIKDVGQYIGKNVSITGLFYAIYYDNANRVYNVEVRTSDEKYAVNVTMTRDQLINLLDPAIVGWKSTVTINGTVKSASTITFITGRVVEKRDPLKVTVAEALKQPIGRP